MEEIVSKIKKIIMDNIEEPQVLENAPLDLELSDIGINSVNFIKIILEIENAFDIEFDDDDLDQERFRTLETFAAYVKSCLD